MSIGKNEVKDFFLAVSVALTILQFFNSFLEIPAFVLALALVIWFIYDKIPGFLNRRFSDENQTFLRDPFLRFALIFFPSAMFLLFALNSLIGYSLLPKTLIGINMFGLGHTIFGIIALLFISIWTFSWRLWKYQELAEQLWKEIHLTKTHFEKEKAIAEKYKPYSLILKYMGPGIVPTGVCILLFLGWLALTITDLLMVGLLLLWFFHDILHRTSLRNTLEKWDRTIERDFLWKAIIKTGIASQRNIYDSAMIFIGFLLVSGRIVFVDLGMFIVDIILLNSWYILLVTFLIGLRSSTRIRIKEGKRRLDKASIFSLPRYIDIVLICSFVIITLHSLSAFIPDNDLLFACYMLSSVGLNFVALTTVILWLKKQAKKYNFSEVGDEQRVRLKEDLLRDRYRLYAMVFFLGIPVATAGMIFQRFVLWIGIFSGVTLLCFESDFIKSVQRQKAGIYATLLTAYLGTGVSIPLVAVIYALPQLARLFFPIIVLFGVLLVFYWLSVFAIKRRWKWK